MLNYTVSIDGMACPMCEAHICETIRRTLPDAKKGALPLEMRCCHE